MAAEVQVEVTDHVLRSLVKAVGPKNFFIGLHNAFAHGEVLKDAGFPVTDKELGKLFKNFEKLIKTAKKIEGE